MLFAFLVALSVFSLMPASAQVTVFSNTASTPRRIPSIVRLNDGKLLAISDYRPVNGDKDIGGTITENRKSRIINISIDGCLSEDNGNSWGSYYRLLTGDVNATNFRYAFGDAATVVDRESGKIMMMNAAGKYGFYDDNKQYVARSYSSDNGATWSSSDVSSAFYTNDTYVKHLFFSSGRMIQSTRVKTGGYYRIYAAVNTRVLADWYAWDNGGSRVVYSDDFGQTWHYLGGISAKPASLGDECKVEELPNGDILLSCRANGYARYIVGKDTTTYGSAGRYFNVYSFSDIEKGTGSWGTVARSGRYADEAAGVATEGQTYGSSTNGEILLVPAMGKDGQSTFVLLQSIPYAGGNTRINGTIYWRELEYKDKYSPDDFVTGWKKYSVNKDGAAFAYSTMVLDKKGNVAFIYEANRPASGSYGGYDIVFESLSLETITNGAYSYSEGPVEGFYTTSDPAWKPNTSAVRITPPTFSPAAGTYRCNQTVELKAEEGMTIYYTLDGSVPTTQSTLYSAPLTISTTTTVNAIAVNANGNSSAVAKAQYIIDKTVAVPQFSVSAGTYDSEQTVALTATGEDIKIYYTLDGSDPTTESTLYTEPLTIGSTTTVKAIAVDAYGNQSDMVTASYVINMTVSAPRFSVSAGTYGSAQTVALTAKGEGVKIYYTLDGSAPTTESTLYSAPLAISSTTTVKAVAVDTYGNKSSVASATYTITSVDNEAEKYGTTISLDEDCTHQLFSNGASNASMDKQPFSYLRHDIAHVQLISASNPLLSVKGAQLFDKKANNMLFREVNGKKYLTLGRGVDGPNKVPYCYAAVVAPKGYRIIRYQMDFDAENSTATNAVVSQYVYDDSKADGVRLVDSVAVKSGMDVWDNITDAANVLYFRFNCNSTANDMYVMLKSLKLTYAIDQPFDAVVPDKDGSMEVHTGLLDLGTFSSNKAGNGGAGYWSFDDEKVITDGQTVNIVSSNGSTPDVVGVGDDTYFVAAANGDYYVEAPQKFRIVGATLNFLRSENINDKVKTTASQVPIASLRSGSEYVLGSYDEVNSVRHYLNLNSSGKVEDGTDPAQATKWTINKSTSGAQEYYTIQSDGKYLSYSNGLTVSSSEYKWIFNKTTSGEWGFRTPKIDSLNYNIKYDAAGKKWVAATGVSYSGAVPMSVTVEIVKVDYTASNFTAAVYDREGTAVSGENTRQLTSTNSAESVELTDFNNDAVRFSISGLTGTNAAALYNVSLRLLPLNPEVQTLKVASEMDGDVVGTSEVTSFNYVFNNGNAVNVLVPRGADLSAAYPITFREAHNEEKTMWYDNGQNENRGTQGGYSNYYLIHSDADAANGLDKDATPYAGARVTSKKVSTARLIATNIEEVAAGTAAELQDNVFDKSKTEPKELSLTDGTQQTVYVYSADEPTFQIMPSGKGSKHIDYRYYTITVKPMVVKETPVVTITLLYSSTLKGANHKNEAVASDGGTADEQHTFVGVTITSKAETAGQTPAGVLSNKEIIAAVREKLASYNNYCGFGSADPYRGILYMDMSSLTTVSVETENGVNPWDAFHEGTADNCLYFMPQGFRRNVENTIAKTDGGYEAVGDIVVSDQQPFFSPYGFRTGTRRAKYDREGTATTGGNSKAEVQNMAVVLPFSVPLDGEGNLKNPVHAADNSVTFHDIIGYGEVTSVLSGAGTDLTYAMLAEAVSDGEARANQPYYVTSTTPGFTFSIGNATFAATPAASDELTRTSTLADGKLGWTARGTYSGEQPAKDKNLWYFSKDFFWKSGQLVSNNHVNIRPFRAYFLSSEEVPGAKAGVVFSHDDIVSTGISDALAPVQPLTIIGGRGFLAVSSAAAATVCVRTVSGQVVAAPTTVEAGQTWRISVPQGVYLVNNLKVVVR